MPFKVEIERKFLVDQGKLPGLPAPYHLTQGYLSFGPKANVRVRLQEEPDQNRGYITIKGEGLVGRNEFEYEIPFEEAQELIKLAQASLVAKRRYHLPVEGVAGIEPDLKWEVDIFEGDNAGLAVAEIELPDENYHFKRPKWLGQDVTEDPAYKNSALARHPYRDWTGK